MGCGGSVAKKDESTENKAAEKAPAANPTAATEPAPTDTSVQTAKKDESAQKNDPPIAAEKTLAANPVAEPAPTDTSVQTDNKDESAQKNDPSKVAEETPAANPAAATEPATADLAAEAIEDAAIAKNVGEIALVRAEDPVTAAVKSWPRDNQTGTIMVKSSPAEIAIGFQECFCCYFNKYNVTLKSVGLWEVKLVEKGTENPDMSKFTQTEGYQQYLWGKDSIGPLDLGPEAPPAEGPEAPPAEGESPGPSAAVVNVGDVAVMSAPNPFTAAVKSWECPYLTGRYVVKEVADEGTVVVGFEECYMVYFHKYSVTMKSEGQWEVKMVEKGPQNADKSGFPPLDQGFFDYGGEKEPLIPLAPFGTGPPAAGGMPEQPPA